MIVYQGPYLTIHFEKENNRFTQHWSIPPNTIDSFKKEMLVYTTFYERYKPSQTVWIQKNFTLQLNQTDFKWIEENVNIPCAKYGNKKAAFIVGEDVLAHLSVMDSFEKEKSIINVSHFASEEDAVNWLNEIPTDPLENIKTKITYEGIDEDGNSILKIKRPSNDIVNTIKSFKDLIEENEFFKKNMEIYSSLTKREKEILIFYSKGKSPKQISEELFLSIQTVRTHWRNIKRKLNIKTFNDTIKFTRAFNSK